MTILSSDAIPFLTDTLREKAKRGKKKKTGEEVSMKQTLGVICVAHIEYVFKPLSSSIRFPSQPPQEFFEDASN